MTGLQHNVRHGLPDLSSGLGINSLPGLAGLFTSSGFNVVGDRVISWVSTNGGLTINQTTEARRVKYEATGWDGKPCAYFAVETASRFMMSSQIAGLLAGTAMPFCLVMVIEVYGALSNGMRLFYATDLVDVTYVQYITALTPDGFSLVRNVDGVNVASPNAAGFGPVTGHRLAIIASFSGTHQRLQYVYDNQVLDTGLVASGTGTFASGGAIAFGSSTTGGSTTLPMRCPEIIFFTQALVSPHDTKLFNILRTRWNLSNL